MGVLGLACFGEIFWHARLVKVRGAVEGHPFRAPFMAMGGGKHMLPMKAEIRKAIGKDVGDVVTVILEERIK